MATSTSPISQPSGASLGAQLIAELEADRWTRLSAGIAYVKMSGVRHLAAPLFAFAQTAELRISVGIDQQGSSLEGVQTLWQVLGSRPDNLYIYHNPSSTPPSTFHPKVWLFENAEEAKILVGSGNLTMGGLFVNTEFGVSFEVDFADEDDRNYYLSLVEALDSWSDPTSAQVAPVDETILNSLYESGELPSEAALRSARSLAHTARAVIAGVRRGSTGKNDLFRGKAVPAAPPHQASPALPTAPVTPAPPVRLGGRGGAVAPINGSLSEQEPAPILALHDELLIEVNPRNKTEIFLAKRLLREDPAFFGWPFLGRTTPKRKGNPGQPQPDPLPSASVTVFRKDGAVAGSIVDDSLKLWTYSVGQNANDDFRLTLAGGLQSKVPDGSILRMTRQPASGLDFGIDIYPPGHPEYEDLLRSCTQQLPQGRRFGWK